MGSLKNKEEMEQIGKRSSQEAIAYVNGVQWVVPDGLAHLTLFEYLRGKYKLILFGYLESVWPRKKYKKRKTQGGGKTFAC